MESSEAKAFLPAGSILKFFLSPATKPIYWFTSFLGILSITFLYGIDSKSNFVSLVDIAIQITIFAAIGILHSVVISRSSPGSYISFKSKMLYIVILPITSVIIIPFFSFTSLENVLLVTFAANCAYLLPFAILNTWINYFLLKQKQIKVWQLENPSVQKEAAGALSNSLRIKFKFTYYQRRKEIIGRAVTSPHTKLGKLFIQIVNKHIEKASQSNKPVMDNNNSFGWLFYVKSFYGLHRRYLDPDVSIVDNNISTTAIIFVKQVKKQN